MKVTVVNFAVITAATYTASIVTNAIITLDLNIRLITNKERAVTVSIIITSTSNLRVAIKWTHIAKFTE